MYATGSKKDVIVATDGGERSLLQTSGSMQSRSAHLSMIAIAFWAISIVAQASTSADEWSIEQVGEWAAANSPTASLIDLERSAIVRGMDCDDDKQRAAAGLIQAVTKELALHERQKAAAEASDVYYRAVAAGQQMTILNEAAPRLDSLDGLAERAELAEIPDGDRDELANRRLQMEDRWYQTDFGLGRLRNQLDALVGTAHPIDEFVVLTSPLLRLNVLDLQPAAHIAEANVNRHDLKAIEAFCRCLNEDSLPAARQLLGTLVPGLGLEALTKSCGSGGLLKFNGRSDAEDLLCRRQQCQQLASARRTQIAAEVRDAILQIREAQARLGVARKRVELQKTIADSVSRAVRLEQKTPGSGQLEELEWLERKALLVERELDLAQAIIALQRAKGLLLF